MIGQTPRSGLLLILHSFVFLCIFSTLGEVLFQLSKKEVFDGVATGERFSIIANYCFVLIAAILLTALVCMGLVALVRAFSKIWANRMTWILGGVPFLLLGLLALIDLNRWYYSVQNGRYLTDLPFYIVILFIAVALGLGLRLYVANLDSLDFLHTGRRKRIYLGSVAVIFAMGSIHFEIGGKSEDRDLVDQAMDVKVQTSHARSALPNIVFITFDSWETCYTPILSGSPPTMPRFEKRRGEFFVFTSMFSNSRNTRSGSVAQYTGRSALSTRVYSASWPLRGVSSFIHFPRYLKEAGYYNDFLGARYYGNPTEMNLLLSFDESNNRSVRKVDPRTDPVVRFNLFYPREGKWLGETFEDYRLQLGAIFLHSNDLHERNRAGRARETIDPPEAISAELKRLLKKKQPFFFRLHSRLTHYPIPHKLKYLKFSGLPYEKRKGRDGKRLKQEDQLNIYKDAIYQADEELDSWIQMLKDEGAWDNTLFIVATDHQKNYEYDGKPVVFFVHLPHVSRGRTIDTPTWHLDITPTILDAIGIESPPVFEGLSLMPLMQGEVGAEKPFYERYIHVGGIVFSKMFGLTILKDGYRFTQHTSRKKGSPWGALSKPELRRAYHCSDGEPVTPALELTPELEPIWQGFLQERDRLLKNEAFFNK